ncbi:hypothetical protein IDJ77_10835 [Mucilaginibacter sp. ZT4R22]|uniref:DUF4136 domain-containing protein n=1 Tax=Mucilaginibacter pankratovii TaxID=2772110 RepID=A0ABR7WPQ3_9SPHI|nr:hypothetical protein [Mucilaginibacter pankratovii]MBD1364304.1 hypothetical protein [Mucilaginibacter pankratovii]
MYKFYTVLLLTAVMLGSCKAQPNAKIWTKEYEQGLYNYLDSTSKLTMPDKLKRQKYVTFLVRRIKEGIPNGINSVSKDSLQSLHIRVEREYALQERGTGNADLIPFYVKWDAYTEKAFRQNYDAIFRTKFPATTGKFCDCVIGKLKKMYPDSVLLPLPKEINTKVSIECIDVLQAP